MARYSATHWCNRWKVMEQLFVQFGDAEKFFKNENLGSPHIQSKLWAIFTDTQKRAFVEIELTAIIDWGKLCVTTTYSLEGNDPLIVSGYDIMETIKSAICVFDTSNVHGVIRRLSSSVLTFQRSQNLLEYARKCVQPGIEYFHRQLATNLKNSIVAFKAARLFSLQKLHIIKLEADVYDHYK